jgi:electron transfer flavoprotein alpha subunit
MTNCIILNGISPDYKKQVSIAFGVIKNPDKAIIIYDNDEDKNNLVSLCPSLRITLLKIPKFDNELILNELEKIISSELVVFPPNIFGQSSCVRLGERLHGSSLTNVENIDGNIFSKKVYSGYMTAEYKLTSTPICISLDKGLSEVELIQSKSEKIVNEVYVEKINNDFIINEALDDKLTSGLESEKYMFTIGNGIKTEEELNKVVECSKLLDFNYGVSRPIAMNGFTEMDKLIGVSGAITKPDICFAIGVSGSPAFFSGIVKSKVIIAVNTDDSAQIFEQCDLGIVGDYRDFIEELTKIYKVKNDL